MIPRRLKPMEDDYAPRWDIGVDRKHVVVYVAAALIAGLAIGFVAARIMGPKEAPPMMPVTSAATSTPTPKPMAVNETAPPDFHKVTRMLRADTLEVEGIGPVRMIGVETPDGRAPKEIYGKYGQDALNFTEKAALSQEVRLEFDPTNASRGNKDDSGQTLAYVYTRDGTLLNSELLREGLAFVRSLEEFKMSNDFRSLERDAMQSLRGVWGSSSGSSTPVSATTASTGHDKPGKTAPLSPSAIGPNIPAITGTSPGAATVSGSEPTVYVSSADRLYHKAGCELLDKKNHVVGLAQARSQGYHPCSRCYPSTTMRAP